LSVCECCVLSGRGLCEELITRPEEFYRLCCVVVCDLETSRMRSWPALGRNAIKKNYSPIINRADKNVGTYSMREWQEKCMEKFGPNEWKEENIWATFW
jgi:hypothetical protein